MQPCTLRSVRAISPLTANFRHISCGILSESCDLVHLVQQSLPFLPMRSIFCATVMTSRECWRALAEQPQQVVVKIYSKVQLGA